MHSELPTWSFDHSECNRVTVIHNKCIKGFAYFASDVILIQSDLYFLYKSSRDKEGSDEKDN